MTVYRSYRASDTSLLLTKCPFYNCLIGGYYCVNCISFVSKDRECKEVRCKRSVGPSVDTLPPQREKQSVTNKSK